MDITTDNLQGYFTKECAVKGDIFQNNTKTQTTSLVSTFSKQFSKLTSRVQETRFCCSKSSVLNSISMELKSLRLDFQQTQKEKQQSIIKPKTQTRKKQ